MSETVRILVVRLGAMGDIINTLPAAASLKQGIANARVSWIVEPRWAPLLEDNPHLDEIIPFDRHSFQSLRAAWQQLRADTFDLAVDFQSLIKSAVVASAARARRVVGFDCDIARECAATWFYSKKGGSRETHVVDQYLDLASAAGATTLLRTFPIPAGRPEGDLPAGPFVLASPLAGWGAKQWPIEFYSALGLMIEEEFGLPLVVNGPKPIEAPFTCAHISGLAGLIDATRRAAAVIGVDSGPLHLAAALGKPGVAIYGPTDPARNGPYDSVMTVLRSADAVTSHKRTDRDDAMRRVSPAQVFKALQQQLAAVPVSIYR